MISTEISPDVAALVELLRGVPLGGTIRYASLSAVIGRDVRRHRHLIESARHVAERDHGAIFGNEINIGYTRLTAEQLPGLGSTARRRIRRASRKARKTINYALESANDVPPTIQRKLNSEISVLNLLEHLAADRMATPVEAHATRPEPITTTGRRLLGLQE
jgi:hypothetical protein